MSSVDVWLSAAIDPVLRFVVAEIRGLHDPGAKLFAYLDDWYVWITVLTADICPHGDSNHISQHCTPVSKIQVWRASCQEPIPPELQDKVKLTLSCLGGHLNIHGDIGPSPIVLGEQAFMEKSTQRFQRIATTLADLNAEGLNAQTVHVCWCSQSARASHELRSRTRGQEL